MAEILTIRLKTLSNQSINFQRKNKPKKSFKINQSQYHVIDSDNMFQLPIRRKTLSNQSIKFLRKNSFKKSYKINQSQYHVIVSDNMFRMRNINDFNIKKIGVEYHLYKFQIKMQKKKRKYKFLC